MPESTRLLYVLADLAYVTKLTQGKKPHDFVLSDFRQINGEFLDENNLIAANLEKLIGKLEAGSYKLILPDFLFTSTIVNIELESEAAVKAHLQDKLLPDLGIDDKDYYLDTTVLSNYKGSFKVQLTALEKSVVAPLTKVLNAHDSIAIESISPLSWATKSIISLEPSVAILQMGEQLFLAEHYIGVDQCYSVPVAEAANFAETVQTLKGAEPSLQTVYLLTNTLVDDAIKEKLKETLPVQQLADLASEQTAMPSYVRQIIEACARTFSIPEFLLPQFKLDKNYQASEVSARDEEEDEDEEMARAANLVKPAVVGDVLTPVEPVAAKSQVEVAVESLDDEEVVADEKVTSALTPEPAVKVAVKKEIEVETEVSLEGSLPQTSVAEAVSQEIDFSQFANLALDPSVFSKDQATDRVVDTQSGKGAMIETTPAPAPKAVIKNHNDGSSVAKMIFIGFLSFVITIALGVGLGLAYLQWTNHQENAKPIVEVQPEVTPTPTPTPEPLPTIVKADHKLLVVNATTKAGYAGTIAAKVKAAEFAQVDAKNAKGVYEAGDHLLVKEDTPVMQALLKELNQATGLNFKLKVGMESEDTTGAYSAIVVLNQ